MVLDRGLCAEFEEKDPFFENTRLDPEILMALGGLLHRWNHGYSLRLFLTFLIISTIISGLVVNRDQ